MKENHLLATSTFLEPKTQDQKLKSLEERTVILLQPFLIYLG
jgi:hypothetical protein